MTSHPEMRRGDFQKCHNLSQMRLFICGLENLTLQLVENWKAYKHLGEEFRGTELQDFTDLENCFDINIDVYKLKKDKSTVHIYKSQDVQDRGCVKLNLYTNEVEGTQGHLSYISNIRSYASTYHCVKCERDFRDSKHLSRHEKICNSVQIPEERFVGGYKHLKMTVFERLESYGISVVDRYCHDFIVFDCESISQPISEETSVKKRRWTAKHVPVSVAMMATFMPDDVNGFPRTECIVSRDPSVLVSEFLAKLMVWKTRIVEEAKKKYKPITSKLNKLIADCQTKENAILEELTQETGLQESQDLQNISKQDYEPVVWCRSLIKDLQNVQSEFQKYVEQVVVLGYNSAKYDINLLKEYLISQFLRDYADNKDESIQVIKQQAAYSSLELGNYLKFLDVYKYQSPNTSLDSFMKAEGVMMGGNDSEGNDGSAKFYFPYEWFDSYDKLDYPGLPPPEEWFSKLKGCNVLGNSEEEINNNYKLCQKKLEEIAPRNPKFENFLVYYNGMDVGPMLTACRPITSKRTRSIC